jgi:hypothetical protein
MTKVASVLLRSTYHGTQKCRFDVRTSHHGGGRKPMKRGLLGVLSEVPRILQLLREGMVMDDQLA